VGVPASQRPDSVTVGKSRERDSNSRPSLYKSAALTD
jgi:hypothetical protein